MRSTLVSLGLGALMVAGAAAGSGGCVGDDVVPASGSPDGGGSGEGGPPARTCTTNADCTGGGVCADGVCCDRACDGVCESCSAPGSEGKCTPVTGAPKHGTCAGDATGPCAGSCDGAKGDACTFPEVACGSGSCAAGTATLPPMCKGGTCGAKVDQACALGCFGETCLGVKSVAAGYSFACAVLTDKKVRCWGDNSSRQVANDATTSYRRPREIPGLTNVQQVAAVFGSVCALLDDKTVKCWGSNSGGQLGNGTTSATPNGVPTLVPGLADATFIGGSSGGHFCAIVTGGAVKCWGGNTSGQIGDGTTAQANAPTLVCAPGSSVGNCVASTGATYVAGGDNHTCAVFAGGQVACWGGNEFAQLGYTKNNTPNPFAANVAGLTGATSLTAGNRMSCAVVGTEAKCWGGNDGSRLGGGDETTTAVLPPVTVCASQDCTTKLAGVTSVSTFDVSTCASAGGRATCWGNNDNGALGDGTATDRQAFAGSTAVGKGVVNVVSGGQTNYAIVVDGANRDVRCWGANTVGECGDDTPGNRPTPVGPKWGP